MECDGYGFRAEAPASADFNPVLPIRGHDGRTTSQDIRSIPFLRFEGNEAHAQRRYGVNLGGPSDHDDGEVGDAVGPDSRHPPAIQGDLGFITSPPSLALNYGGDGQGYVSQMNAVLNIPGMNFASDFGNSADLGFGPPPGIGYTFSSSQPNADQLLLTYHFVNNTGSALAGFHFIHYIDPNVGGDFPFEYATVNGLGSLGQPGNPTSFQVSDGSFGAIFSNMATGTLSNSNDLPSAAQSGDVSIGLGLTVASLGIGQAVSFEVLLSDDGSSLGNFSISEHDPNNPGDGLTVSAIVLPEPSSLSLLALGSLAALGLEGRRRFRVQAWTRSQ